MALARHVAGHDLRGKRAVELGCGVGLPSAVALARGADVLVTDHYGAALAFAAHNARANAGREPDTMLLDWHDPPAELPDRHDLVLAADVLYERRNVSALAALVPRLLSPGGELWLADPRREDAPPFLEALRERGFRGSRSSAVVVQAGREVRVLVHGLRRA